MSSYVNLSDNTHDSESIGIPSSSSSSSSSHSHSAMMNDPEFVHITPPHPHPHPHSQIPSPPPGFSAVSTNVLEISDESHHLHDDYDHSDHSHEEDSGRCCSKKWRITLASFALLLGGIILMIFGIVRAATSPESSSVGIFFVIGILLSVPGGYFTYRVVQAWRRIHGFSFEIMQRR